MNEQKEKYKIIVMAILLAGACFLTYYFHVVRETGTIFTHFFYIPIILAALWWKRKGLVVAIFLAALIIFSHIFVREDVVTANDYFRALMFVVIAFVVATLREQIAKAQEKTAHLNAILRAIRNVNQLIVREKDHDRLIQRTCDYLIETRGYYSAWIALVDENQRFLTAAEAGLGDSFSQIVEMMKHGEFTRCGQNALEQSGIMIVKDAAADCADCPLASTYAGRAGMAIRLEHRDRIYGILSVSIPVEMAIDADEQSLFNEVASDITFALHDIELEEARKQVEAALKKEKSFSANVIATVPNSLIVVDKDLRIKKANLSFQKIFGLDPEKVVGTRITDILGDEDEKLSTVLSKLLGTKTSMENLESHYYSEKLGERIFNIRARGMLIAAEEEEELVVLEDITERKCAETEIRKLSSAVEQAIDGMAIYDLDRKLSYVNDAFALMHGYSPEEMIGMKVENLHNEERLDEYRKGMNQIMTQGSWTGETRHLKKDGTLFPAFMTVSLLKGDDGNHPGILAVARDITKQKRAEVRLQEREAQYRGIFNSATDSLLIFDTDGNIEEVNPQACEMYGYLYEELIALSGKDIVHPDYYHIFEQFKRDVQTTGEFHAESIDVRKDGTPFNIEFKGALFNYKGEPHLLAIVRDITERKRAEERVKEAYRLRENFLKETSHRIITPVTIIGGYTEVLLDSRNLDDVQKERIRTIQEKNDEVQKLVMDALAGRYLKEEETEEGDDG